MLPSVSPKPPITPPHPRRGSKRKEKEKEKPSISEDTLAELIADLSNFNFDEPEDYDVEDYEEEEEEEEEVEEEKKEEKRDTLSIGDITGIMSVLDDLE